MPTSSHFSLTPMVREIMETKPCPKSILDVGCGYGKWGYFCRESLEAQHDRVYPKDWIINIEGIEIWPGYAERLPWIKHFYNKMHTGDAYDVINTLGNYDLIIFGDVIEHLEKDRGRELLRKGMEKANTCCLLSIPIGDWTHKLALRDNNKYEQHISIWSENEIIEIAKECGIRIENYFIQRQRNPLRAEVCVMAFRK